MTTTYQRNWTEENGVKALKELEKLGVKINKVDKAPFQKAVEPFYQQKAYPTFGKELVSLVLNWPEK